MSLSPGNAQIAAPNDATQALASLSGTLLQNLLQMQTTSLQTWLSWQQSMNKVSQELWDEWRCHFAGGAPIGD